MGTALLPWPFPPTVQHESQVLVGVGCPWPLGHPYCLAVSGGHRKVLQGSLWPGQPKASLSERGLWERTWGRNSNQRGKRRVVILIPGALSSFACLGHLSKATTTNKTKQMNATFKHAHTSPGSPHTGRDPVGMVGQAEGLISYTNAIGAWTGQG